MASALALAVDRLAAAVGDSDEEMSGQSEEEYGLLALPQGEEEGGPEAEASAVARAFDPPAPARRSEKEFLFPRC